MSLVFLTDAGSITVPEHVLVRIAVRAAQQVEGVSVRRRRSIDVENRVVKLSLAAKRGEPLVELGERAQDEVASALETMCGIEARVDLRIGEIE
jgi:uncharacterized alkaline shock family protein YloU